MRTAALGMYIATLFASLAAAATAPPAAPVIATSDARFEQDVVQASDDHLVVVVFEAGWCLPCRGTVGQLGAAARSLSFSVVTMDVDANSVVPDRLKVSSLPVVIAYRGGKAVGTHVGPWGGNYTLDNFLDQVRAFGPPPAE